MNDGKLLQDDLKTFDDWKQSSGCISTSVGSYPRMTYPSPTFHTTVFALSGVAGRIIWVDISRGVNVNTLTSRLCVTPSTPSQMTCSTAWLPTKNVVTHQRRRVPTSVSPARCQVPRKCARVRAWKRIMRRKIAQRARWGSLKMCNESKVLCFFSIFWANPYLGWTIANWGDRIFLPKKKTKRQRWIVLDVKILFLLKSIVIFRMNA